jgi:hypothetical protein
MAQRGAGKETPPLGCLSGGSAGVEDRLANDPRPEGGAQILTKIIITLIAVGTIGTATVAPTVSQAQPGSATALAATAEGAATSPASRETPEVKQGQAIDLD